MFIYKTTNLINGKIYIGKYSGRKRNYIGSGTLLKYAIEKYGRENFVREIIEDDIQDGKLLNEREKYWIAFYDSQNKEIGYNIGVGGEGNYNPSQESREKYAERMKGNKFALGYKHTPETLAYLSEIGSGENNNFYGRHHTEETKEFLSELNKGKSPSQETLDKAHQANIGRKHTEEELKKMSESQIGEKNHAFGKQWSEEEKEAHSKRLKGIPKSEETKKRMSEAQKGEKHPMYNKHHTPEASDKITRGNQGVKRKKNTSSKYIGVSLNKKSGTWSATIIFKKEIFRLGTFKTEEDAALAYNKKAIELYGESAKINIIEENDNE